MELTKEDLEKKIHEVDKEIKFLRQQRNQRYKFSLTDVAKTSSSFKKESRNTLVQPLESKTLQYLCEDDLTQRNLNKQVDLIKCSSSRAVEEGINKILRDLENHLQSVKFKGCFKPIGSFHSDLRVGDFSEYDYLFEFDVSDFSIEQHDNGTYKVYVNEAKQDTCEIYKRFEDEINNAFEQSKVTLVEGLQHGGFASPQSFSGVRRNEPAVTLMFVWKHQSDSHELNVTVDLTPAFGFPQHQQDILERVYKNIVPSFPKAEIYDKFHLVPLDPGNCEWYLSSAVLERTLFSDEFLPNTLNVKRLIKTCKVLTKSYVSDQLTASHENYKLDIPLVKWILHELGIYQKSMQTEHRTWLSRILSLAHILLNQKESERFGESCHSPIVSVNSTAIKYLALNPAIVDSSAHHYTTHNIFHHIVTSNGQVSHPFLPYSARVFALASYAINNKDNFISEARELMIKRN